MVEHPRLEYEKDYFVNGAYREYKDYDNHGPRVERLIRLTNNPKSVLDVGCAYGFIVGRLVTKGIDAYGSDVSKWCQQQAEKIIPGRFALAPAHQLPFPDKRFDVLYCEGVLEHIEEYYIYLVFQEFQRVARQRVLVLTFDCARTRGHLCNHSIEWWFDKIPNDTYLYSGDNDSSGPAPWWYKNKQGVKEIVR